PEFPRQFIGMINRWRRSSDPDQIGRLIESHLIDDLVGVEDLMLSRRERRYQRHRELRKLDQAAITEATRFRRLRSDQMNAHEQHRTAKAEHQLFPDILGQTPNSEKTYWRLHHCRLLHF